MWTDHCQFSCHFVVLDVALLYHLFGFLHLIFKNIDSWKNKKNFFVLHFVHFSAFLYFNSCPFVILVFIILCQSTFLTWFIKHVFEICTTFSHLIHQTYFWFQESWWLGWLNRRGLKRCSARSKRWPVCFRFSELKDQIQIPSFNN